MLYVVCRLDFYTTLQQGQLHLVQQLSQGMLSRGLVVDVSGPGFVGT
jgi:hypothetical protein